MKKVDGHDLAMVINLLVEQEVLDLDRLIRLNGATGRAMDLLGIVGACRLVAEGKDDEVEIEGDTYQEPDGTVPVLNVRYDDAHSGAVVAKVNEVYYDMANNPGYRLTHTHGSGWELYDAQRRRIASTAQGNLEIRIRGVLVEPEFDDV